MNVAISESAVMDREKFTKKQSRQELAKEQIFPDDYRPVGELVKIDEDGVTFTSHWDGSAHRFTPEKSLEIQHVLGADMMIAFDECAPFPTTHEYARKALERTHRWAVRSLDANKKASSRQQAAGSKQRAVEKKNLTVHRQPPAASFQALYGVIQGSVYEDLRKQSADFISSLNFAGIAIGGVAVGEGKREMRHAFCAAVGRENPRTYR